MGKMQFKVGAKAATAELDASFTPYEGEIPPGNTTYPVLMRQLRVKTANNPAKNKMLNFVLEIDAPEDSDKAQYNGYGFWVNLNITEEGAPWVNNFLDAFGFDRKTFWTQGLVTDPESKDANTPHVLRIGNVKVDKDGMEAIAFVKGKPATAKYERSLDLVRFEIPEGGVARPTAADAEDVPDTPDEETAADADADADVVEPYTEDELKGMDFNELKRVAMEEFELTVPAGRATSVRPKLVAAIIEAQGEPEADDAAEGEGDPDDYTEAELRAMSLEDLTAAVNADFADEIKLDAAPFYTRGRRGRPGTVNVDAVIARILEIQEEEAGSATKEPPF